ncbi:MAG: hypothetical protein JST54_05625 [Deltaproteobacteria bacterium]|nr:hypothetical protein [Deltaproteobacteria bacterium]
MGSSNATAAGGSGSTGRTGAGSTSSGSSGSGSTGAGSTSSGSSGSGSSGSGSSGSASSGSTGSASSGSGSSGSSGSGSSGSSGSGSTGGANTGDFFSCGCLAPSPYCDPQGSGYCVQCLSDADCATPTPRCAPTNSCVGCLGDPDCASGQVCDPNLNQCIDDCRSAGCDSNFSCDTATGRCAWGCRADKECSPQFPFCSGSDGGLGHCFGCRSDADCPVWTPGCSAGDAGEGSCGSALSQADCPAPLTYDASFGACVCDPANDLCGQLSPLTPKCVLTPITQMPQCGCSVNSDCAAGEFCDLSDFSYLGAAGVCVTGCDTDGGLAGHTCEQLSTSIPLTCNPARGRCSSCMSNTDCQDPRLGGPDRPICIPGGGYQGGGTCGCQVDTDCPGGEICETSIISTGQCVASCNAPGGPDCLDVAATNGSEAYFCDSTTGHCVPCSSDGECQGLFGQVKPVCVGASTGAGECGCSTSADCDPGSVCQTAGGAFGAGACAPRCDVADGGADYCTAISAGSATECNGLGQCAVCLTDQDCAFNVDGKNYCEVESGGCVLCTSYNQCRQGAPGCLSDVGCGFCHSDANCAPAAHCDANTGVCRYPCQVSFGQTGGVACPQGQPFCNALEGTCFECRIDTDCKEPGHTLSACNTANNQCVYGG